MNSLPIAEASYGFVSKNACFEGTRVDLRRSITSKLRNGDEKIVFLRGSPGKGKTAIAKSIAIQFNEEGKLGASFFFDKNGTRKGTSDITMFVPTLARQLARCIPAYRFGLAKIISTHSQSGVNSPRKQLDELIIRPLRTLFPPSLLDKSANMPPLSCPSPSPGNPWVIVLDGLDECGTPEMLTELIGVVKDLDSLPSFFRVLISCRPDPQVRQGLSGVVTPEKAEDLDNIPAEVVRGDVRNFVFATLKFKNADPEDRWPPPDERIEVFMERCGLLFELGAVRMRQIRSGGGRPMLGMFDEILLETRGMEPELEREYLRILRRGFPELVHDPLPPKTATFYQLYKKILGSLISLRDPLSIGALSDLLGVDIAECQALLRPLSSVICVPSRPSEPVYFYHATFREYLISAPLAKNADLGHYYRFPGLQHQALLEGCMIQLNSDQFQQWPGKTRISSRGNFYLDVSLEPTRLIPHTRVKSAMLYACQFWGTHLPGSSSGVNEMIRAFLQERFTFWLMAALVGHFQVLRVLDRLYLMLAGVAEWCKVKSSFCDIILRSY